MNPCILIYNNPRISILIGIKIYEEYAHWQFGIAINQFGSALHSASRKLHQPGEEDVANSIIMRKVVSFGPIRIPSSRNPFRRLDSHALYMGIRSSGKPITEAVVLATANLRALCPSNKR